MTVEEFLSLQIGDWVDAGVMCEIKMIAQDAPRAYGVLVAGASGLTQLCEVDCASMKKVPPPAWMQRTLATAIDRTAEIIMQNMGFSDCRDHGIRPPMLEMFDTPDGPGLMPVCCCTGTAYPVYYGYVIGWTALPEERRPKRPWKLVVSLGENPNLKIDENSSFRLSWRDQLQGVVEAGYCEVHGGDTNAIVSINHREDGMSEFDVAGCCAPFEEASRFAMVLAMKSSMTVK